MDSEKKNPAGWFPQTKQSLLQSNELYREFMALEEYFDALGSMDTLYGKKVKKLGLTINLNKDVIAERHVMAGFFAYSMVRGSDQRISSRYNNKIVFGSSVRDRETLFGCLVHETMHAFQYYEAAALHADPVNLNSPVIVCPRDEVRLTELGERDASRSRHGFARSWER